MTTTAPTSHETRAAALLISRLVRLRGLTALEALAAVDQAHRKATGPHTHLVHQEATQLLTEMTASVRAALEALRPVAAAAARAMADLSRALAPVARQATTRPDRPAWASPYGPPARRRT
ncbi:hypothetical protein [Streptomyces anulatus]|uniref:hypothetical protein n=1 Tax=Streptomyces anulatus TaxID=1892 RepID=UPI0036974623